VSGLKRLVVNGQVVNAKIQKGYAVITREWKPGDKIEVEFPMEVQRVKADSQIKADVGLVALRYGPLVYNVEKADQSDLDQALSAAPLKAEWRSDLLGGVMTINGKWQSGTPMLAIPNYARMNRIVPDPVEAGGDPNVNYAPGATAGAAAATGNSSGRRSRRHTVQSIVWMKDQA
jgi:hypothetical protein